jgi:two-component system osmolarity sensor histidine kinase EnvZ
MQDRALRFSVEDDGPGIPPELRGDAVQPFLRLDSARNQDRGSGVGLGLAIANDIAGAMAARCASATARRWGACAST